MLFFTSTHRSPCYICAYIFVVWVETLSESTDCKGLTLRFWKFSLDSPAQLHHHHIMMVVSGLTCFSVTEQNAFCSWEKHTFILISSPSPSVICMVCYITVTSLNGVTFAIYLWQQWLILSSVYIMQIVQSFPKWLENLPGHNSVSLKMEAAYSSATCQPAIQHGVKTQRTVISDSDGVPLIFLVPGILLCTQTQNPET